MTLLLTLVARDHVLQVGDRLVTQGEREFDPESNKAVLFRAKDAVVVISYSGTAFVSGIPTDEWIALQLTGHVRFIARVPYRPASILGRLPRWADLGRTVASLVRSIENELSKSKESIGLVIAGWQWRRRDWDPGAPLREVTFDGASGRLAVRALPRYWHWSRNGYPYCLSALPRANLPTRVGADLRQALGSNIGAPDACSQPLISAIREVAASNKTVGSGCMRIAMPRPTGPGVEVEYHPPPTQKSRTKDLHAVDDRSDLYYTSSRGAPGRTRTGRAGRHQGPRPRSTCRVATWIRPFAGAEAGPKAMTSPGLFTHDSAIVSVWGFWVHRLLSERGNA